ncbi:MAG: hypothetical protein FWD64_01915 [Acidobacteriaceae bacterium]|nr:hypothetical protein [Acidobacteriaceae bacterium]
MKLLASLVTLGLLASPAFAETRSFQNVTVIDQMCSRKAATDFDAHTRECALACEKSGFGIITADGQFLKFDAEGNARIIEQLKASKKVDHLRVNVTGDVDGDTLKVTSIELQ